MADPGATGGHARTERDMSEHRPLSAAELESNAEAFARIIEQERANDVHVVLARVGSSWIAVPAGRVLRVTRAVMPHRIPHRSHRALRGLANIDGEVAIVMDLASLCGFTWTPSGEGAARMVVLGERGAAWAFEADEVPGTVSGSSSDLLAAPLTVAATGAGFTTHLMPCATGHAGILDVDALLAACAEAVRS
jgi:chemotaxis signal transduction protein